MDFSIERNRSGVSTHHTGQTHRAGFHYKIREARRFQPAEAEYAGSAGAGMDPEVQAMSRMAPPGQTGRFHQASHHGNFGSAYQWAGRGLTPPSQPEMPAPAPEPELPADPGGVEESGAPAPEPQPQVPVQSGQVPQPGAPLQGGMPALTISGDNIPQEIAQYARMEGGQLVIDGGGAEIPPLEINRSNVTIKNVRIQADGQPNIHINGASNITISDSEITGGTRGIRADDSSNITVANNWLHDMSWGEKYDTTAIEFDHVSGGVIQGNRVSNDADHPFRSDAVSMFNSQNLSVTNNQIDVIIDEPSSSPLMVEGSTSNNIEVANNNISYSGPSNVPPGLLGGTNLSGHDNTVNGDPSKNGWQLYAYDDVWQNVVVNGEQIA